MLLEQAQRHYQGEAGRRYQQHQARHPRRRRRLGRAACAPKNFPRPSVPPTLSSNTGSAWAGTSPPCSAAAKSASTSLIFWSRPSAPWALNTLPKQKPSPMARWTWSCAITRSNMCPIRRLFCGKSAGSSRPTANCCCSCRWSARRNTTNSFPANRITIFIRGTRRLWAISCGRLGFDVAEAGTGEFGYSRFAAVWASKLHLGETGFRCLRRLLHIVKPAREVRIIAVKSKS